MSPAESALRFLRILHGVLLASVFLYAALGEKLGPAEPRNLEILPAIFALPAIINVAIALLMRSRMMGPAAETLRLRPDEPQALGRWRAGNIISLILCESVALFGFVLRMVGATLPTAVPFYAAAILLMIVWTPRLEVSGPGAGQ